MEEIYDIRIVKYPLLLKFCMNDLYLFYNRFKVRYYLIFSTGSFLKEIKQPSI